VFNSYKLKTGIVSLLSCCPSKQNDMRERFLKKGNLTLDKELNIIELIRHNEEFRIIKRLLFTSDEIELIRDITSQSLLFDDNIIQDNEFKRVKQSLKEFIREKNRKGKPTVRREILDLFEDKIDTWFADEDSKES